MRRREFITLLGGDGGRVAARGAGAAARPCRRNPCVATLATTPEIQT